MDVIPKGKKGKIKAHSLGLGGRDETLVLLGVTLLDTALDHLLHDHVGVKGDGLLDAVAVDGPLALNVVGARRGLAVNDSIDAGVGVNQGQSKGGLPNGALVCDLIC